MDFCNDFAVAISNKSSFFGILRITMNTMLIFEVLSHFAKEASSQRIGRAGEQEYA
jgi:hypothetical protein